MRNEISTHAVPRWRLCRPWRPVLGSLIVLMAAQSSRAQDWAKAMLTGSAYHDFGTVDRGSTAEHRVTLTNKYKEDARIVALRTSCGCIIGRIDRSELRAWDKAEITIAVNTRVFPGRETLR